MVIKSSTSLRNEYNDVSNYCKNHGKPVYITKNGEGDLVVMSIEAYEEREERLGLREKLLEAEMQKMNGAKVYSIEQVSERLKGLIYGEI